MSNPFRYFFTPIEETIAALDTLVRQGKVRYIGFSDTPAWKVAQAQTLAHFRDYTPLIALQIEYSLLQRTVEGDLMPMARELGLGVMPWSPLKGGVLSGKYKREDHGKNQPGRGARITNLLDERTYALLDLLGDIAREHDTTVARVALAWLRTRPGVTSPIIGARTLDQLNDNLAALEVTLTQAQITKLNEASKPQLAFPADFVAAGTMFYFGGTTIDGQRNGFGLGVTLPFLLEAPFPTAFSPKKRRPFQLVPLIAFGVHLEWLRLLRAFAGRRLRTTARRQIDCRHPEPATVISSVARVSVFCDCATHKFLMTARVSQACEVA